MNAVEVSGLTKRFGKVEAVRGISFTVARGATAALLGGNGAGKTTTISTLLGVLLPTSGRIVVLGEDMARHRYRVLPRMNFTSPYVDLPRKLTVEENLTVFARLYGVAQPRKRIAALVEILDLGEFRKRAYGTLSAGQRTRVSIAKALHQTSIFDLGVPLVSFFANLLVTAWSVGLMVSALVMRYGLAAENFAWGAIFIAAPLSGIYYPIAVLPPWLQAVAWWLPTSHVFEGMRAVLLEGTFRWDYFWTTVALNALYLLVAVAVFLASFNGARKRGMLLQIGE